MKLLKSNLLTQILIAFVIAIILGLIFGKSIEILAPLGDLFLRMIKFIIAPLVLSTLITGWPVSEIPNPWAEWGLKHLVII